MYTIRPFLLGFLAALLLVVWLPLTAHPDIACGQAPHHAGVVVSPAPMQEQSFCIPFSSRSISGLELLRATGLPVETRSYPFGEMVCKVAGVGAGPEECPAPDGSYWAYFHLEAGKWKGAAAGASQHEVRCGSVDGWAWYPGGSGRPPASSNFSTICRLDAKGQSPRVPSAALEQARDPKSQPSPSGPQPVSNPDLAPLVAFGGIILVLGCLRLYLAAKRQREE